MTVKAVYYKGIEICRKPENPRDCIAMFNRVTDCDYVGLSHEYARNHMSVEDIAKGTDEIWKQIDEAIWDGWYEWLEIRDVEEFEEDCAKEEKNMNAKANKIETLNGMIDKMYDLIADLDERKKEMTEEQECEDMAEEFDQEEQMTEEQENNTITVYDCLGNPYEMERVHGHFNIGCPICDSQMEALGVMKRSRMPTLYAGICKMGHRLVLGNEAGDANPYEVIED